MRPNRENFSVKYFMGGFSVFYLNYHMFCLTNDDNELTDKTKEMALKTAVIMIDIIADNWPNTEYFNKIQEIHESIICSHQIKETNGEYILPDNVDIGFISDIHI